MGSTTDRLILTQQNVDTLIQVYYDTGLTTKNVTGYVHKDTLTNREYYLLTQLGLNVTYNELVADTWSLTASSATIRSGETVTIGVSGSVLLSELTLSIESCSVEYGTIPQATALQCFALNGNVLSFTGINDYGNFVAGVTIKATPVWGAADAKTVAVKGNYIVNYHKVWLPSDSTGFSASLFNEGASDLIDDYISRCKCYVFNSNGTKKAEIKSATFVGDYSGMTSGTVTFADDTVANIGILNDAGCNFMVLRPEMNISVGSDMVHGVYLINTGAYNMFNGITFPKKYIGMFKAFNQSGILKSQPNRIPTGGQTIAAFQNQAMAGGANYGLWNYTDWCKENALHISAKNGTNYEQTVGTGRINNYNYVRNIVTGFTLSEAAKYRCGTVATVDSQGNAVNCLNFYGIEGLGEQIWEFVIGFRHDGATAYIWDDNNWGEAHAADRTFAIQLTSRIQNSYIKSVRVGYDATTNTQYFDMFPTAVNGTATTGFCDGHWFANTGRLLFVGGHAYYGSACGLSASFANYAFSYSDAAFGGRLAFYGEPETVSGSELLA